ncbi:MAG TPA: response regulator [Myxococcales bacterium]|jgi:CheY-like chemotaxis protein
MIEILLVDDSPADVRLTVEALKEAKVRNNVQVAYDGESALVRLRDKQHRRPDLILLDLNLPGMDGREVLAEIKRDPELSVIPVVVLTTSRSEEDVLRSYRLHANCYITKPVDLNQFIRVVQSIDDFWFTVVRLAPNGEQA